MFYAFLKQKRLEKGITKPYLKEGKKWMKDFFNFLMAAFNLIHSDYAASSSFCFDDTTRDQVIWLRKKNISFWKSMPYFIREMLVWFQQRRPALKEIVQDRKVVRSNHALLTPVLKILLKLEPSTCQLQPGVHHYQFHRVWKTLV